MRSADEAFELGRVAWEREDHERAFELLQYAATRRSQHRALALYLAAGLLEKGHGVEPGVEPFDFYWASANLGRVFRRGGSEGWGREAWFD